MKRVTWSKNGEWGIVGVEVDWSKLQTGLYGPLMKLKRMEDCIEQMVAKDATPEQVTAASEELINICGVYR